MKVCVSSAGRFWTFDLARQMERQGYLSRLYTGYPRWKVDGLPRDKVRTFPWLFAPVMAAGRVGLHDLQRRMQGIVARSFDSWAARSLEPCDVFQSLSSFGLESHRVAKERYGALTVCDRGSSHILYQDEVMAEEYARWGLRYRPVDPGIVERELGEYEFCDLIAVPSEFVRRTFIQKGVPESKLVKLPYGVDLELFRPAPKEDNVFRVIYVGAMSLRKGLPYLLEAIAGADIPQLDLWLVGDTAPDVHSFLAKYEGRYRYFGVVPRHELYKYYSQASVFVIASIEEGLALVQAQAMACGLPVIATTNTGAEDLFSDGVEGFIVPIRSPEAIREKLTFLYEHPGGRNEMAESALRKAQSWGGWDRYGNAVTACYRRALSGSRADAGRPWLEGKAID